MNYLLSNHDYSYKINECNSLTKELLTITNLNSSSSQILLQSYQSETLFMHISNSSAFTTLPYMAC